MTVEKIIALSELSDEPRDCAPFRTGHDFSQRMIAVLDRLPQNQVRISNALENAGVLTVSKLQTMTPRDLIRLKNFGSKYIKDVRMALAHFGLTLSLDPVVVPDGATPGEAHVQRLQKWIDERLKHCDRRQDESGPAYTDVWAHVERRTLIDVMLILDGRDPTNDRSYDRYDP